MTIPFTQIPANLRVPLFFAELDLSRSNLAVAPTRSLIVAQINGTAIPAGVPIRVEGTGWAQQMCGFGSMATLMITKFRQRYAGELWLLPLADDGSSVKAAGAVTFTAVPTTAGVYFIDVAGVTITQPVASTQTTAQIATAFAATINANPTLPVTAAATSNSVALTARNGGLSGNDIPLIEYRGGAAGGQIPPPGLATTLTQMANGSVNPSLAPALANLGSVTYDYIALPYTDTASLDAMKVYLADRWSWDRMLYGGAFAAAPGSLGQLTTLGTARNDAHVSIMGVYKAPEPTWLWAAAITAAVAESMDADVALPLQTVTLNVLPPAVQYRFALLDQNALLFDGVSTFTVADDGTVAIQNLITTYQLNAYGQPDDSLLEVERAFTIAKIIRGLKAQVTSTFGRFKLADDGTNFRPGSNIVTPRLIANAVVGWYRQYERDGLAQNSDAFKANIIVQRASSNRCRVDGILPIVPIDQLRQFAALIQPRNSDQVVGA